jgi:3-methyladenine DNA glycosylase/8-oxoguanine DNA glycosylase
VDSLSAGRYTLCILPCLRILSMSTVYACRIASYVSVSLQTRSSTASSFQMPRATPETVSTRDTETLEWLRDYFQLDVDLVKLYGEWAERDPVFAKLRTRFEGIRMLRQDPWENLISCASSHFICPSQRSSHRLDSYALRTTTSPVSQQW